MHSTVFGQVLKLVPRYDFDSLAAAHHQGRKLRSMTRWNQFVALALGQLAGRHSLRDIETNLAAQEGRLYHLGATRVARSSLARVNEEQPYTLYEALFARLYEACARLAPRHGFRFTNKLYSLDASLIDLSLKVFPWAHYALGKAAMKLHVGLDHDGYLPAFANITHSRTSDMEGARAIAFPRGSIVVYDKGYSAFGWHKLLIERGIFFVTRTRATIQCETVERHDTYDLVGVESDKTIRLTGLRARPHDMPLLRRVTWRDAETGKRYSFLTNIFHLDASTVADIYKARWQVELFFKWIKQNLRIKAFLGTTRNAILTQIWVALCVALLIAYAKFLSRTHLSAQAVLRLLQLSLFLRRDLNDLIRGLPPNPKLNDPRQAAFAL
jgi:putative transposase